MKSSGDTESRKRGAAGISPTQILEVRENISNARHAFDGDHLSPPLLEKGASMTELNRLIDDGISASTTDWSSLLSRLEAFTTLVDGLAEACDTISSLSTLTLVYRFTRTRRWLGILYLQRRRSRLRIYDN